jgi:hypothetical protein
MINPKLMDERSSEVNWIRVIWSAKNYVKGSKT